MVLPQIYLLLTSLQLNSLVANGIVESYPPLVDKKGSYTAQFEHVSFQSIGILEAVTDHAPDHPHPPDRQGGHQPRRGLLDKAYTCHASDSASARRCRHEKAGCELASVVNQGNESCLSMSPYGSDMSRLCGGLETTPMCWPVHDGARAGAVAMTRMTRCRSGPAWPVRKSGICN